MERGSQWDGDLLLREKSEFVITAPREAGNDTAPSLSLQNGGTPLLYAVRGNHVKCVEALLGNAEDLHLVLGLESLLVGNRLGERA